MYSGSVRIDEKAMWEAETQTGTALVVARQQRPVGDLVGRNVHGEKIALMKVSAARWGKLGTQVQLRGISPMSM